MARHRGPSQKEQPNVQSNRVGNIDTKSFELDAQGQTHTAAPSGVDQYVHGPRQETSQLRKVLEESISSNRQDENRFIQPLTAKSSSVAIKQRLATKMRFKNGTHLYDREHSINGSMEGRNEASPTCDRDQIFEQEVRNYPKGAQKSNKESLCSAMLSDIASIPKATYWLWKWLIVLYVLWIALIFLDIWLHVGVTEAFQSICSTRIGRRACPSFLQIVPQQPTTLSKITAAQNETYTEVERIISDIVFQRNLPSEILNREYALRDLAIRVKHSGLENKWEISTELDQLTDLTASTSM